jgi:catechol 2,3-dioxygenase-like lactoylglutathione lyase family enzyme
MPTTFTRAVPVLASLNLDETVEFYTQKLGFTVDFQYPNYLGLKRDNLQLHFWLCSDRHIAENTSCYVYVQDITPLHEEYKTAGVIHPNGDLTEQTYGMRDFAIVDGHGNLIRFGEPV